MYWIGITSLIVLGSIAVGLAYLMLSKYLKKTQGLRSTHPGPEVEKSKAEDSVPKAGATIAHTQETAEEDVQVQTLETRQEGKAERLLYTPDASEKLTEIPPREEPQKGKSEDLLDGESRAKAKEEQSETTSKKTRERQPRETTGAAVNADVPLTRHQLTAAGEGKPDEVTEQIAVASRAEVQQRKVPKPKRKRKRRQLPTPTRTEVESEEEKQLLAGVPEILERQKDWESIERVRVRHLGPPSPYRPPSQEPLAAPQPPAKRRQTPRAPQKAFALTVRLLFERSGYFRVSLLPQREADLPEEIVLGQGENGFPVTAVHDAWYEDVFPGNLAELLEIGVTWEGREESELLGYWALSGRALYVLAIHSDLRGPAQVTRLKIGRKHVVLCRDSLLPEVEPILEQAGCAGFTKLDDSYGAPVGWTVIRDVVPTNVVRVDNGHEILSILQPAPDLEIDLQGGIYLHQATWLSGFPPNISVLGDMGVEIEVFIDGNKAVKESDGSYRNQGYDTIGEHRVSIPLANISKTYRISESDEEWAPWNAYNLKNVYLCGPLLVVPETMETPHAVVVPSCNSVIIGPEPGEIVIGPHICGSKQVGCVTFHPVWALPRDAFGCDKRTTRILLLNARRIVSSKRHHFSKEEDARVLAWSAAILNASRKGLCVDSKDPHTAVLWGEYKAHARSLWRMLRR